MTKAARCPKGAGASLVRNFVSGREFLRIVVMLALSFVIFARPQAFADVQATPDWTSSVTPPLPGHFPMLPSVKLSYKMGWLGIPAGEATAFFRAGDAGRLSLDITGRSTGAARAIWRLDATHRAVADAASLMPLTVHQVEEYGWKTVTTDLEFQSDGIWKFRYNKPYDPKPPLRKRVKLPMVRDMHTAILFVRSQKCAPGDEYTMVVYPGSSGYLVRVLVRGREKLSVRAGKFDAIKCELKIQGINKKRELVPFTDAKRTFVWFSDDEHRWPLKVQSQVFIGSVWADLQSVQPLKK
jgi:hypothetical protein